MIDQSTELYCIFANPVTHTQSPTIHNHNFARHHINAVYLAFDPPDIKSAVTSMRTLGIKGASVTIPFKETRNYVQNVLAFSIIYAQHLGLNAPMLTEAEKNTLL